MRKSLGFLLLSVFTCLSCSVYDSRVLDEDFLEPLALADSFDVEQEIVGVKTELSARSDDPGLHRKLAVLYRMLGTPYSRAMSIEEIEKAIALDPDDPINHIEKGLTLYAMRFNREAAGAMKDAIKADPGSFHAWYQLARIEKDRYLVNMCFNGHKEEAIRYYKKAYNIDDTHEDTLFNLGFLHLLRRMLKTSLKYAEKAASLYPGNPRHHLLLGSVYFRMGEFERSSSEFDKAISLMKKEESRYYIETLPLLSMKQREEYGRWPDEQRSEWNRKFWIRNDPTPATELNERLLTHYDRVFFSRELLTHKRLGIDGAETARGFALISYGLPDKFLYNLGEGIHGAMVIWEYSAAGTGFRLYFQDEFLNGNYIIPIDPGFMAIAEATQNIFNSVDQAYDYPVEFIPAPVHAVTAQTRAPDDNTRIEFAVAVPDSALSDIRDTYTTIVSIFDPGLTRLVNESFRIRPDTLLAITKAGETYRVFDFDIDMIPPEGVCTVVMELTGGRPFRRGTWQAEGEIAGYPGNKLGLSSVKLVLPESDGSCGELLDPIPVYPHGSRLCLAYEIYGLSRGDDLMSRYRLTYTIKPPPESDEGMGGFRRMMYWIARSARGGEDREFPFVSSSLQQSIDSRDVSDNIQIDLGTVEPGKYILHVLVEDLSGGGSVSSEREFIVTGPAGVGNDQ